MILNENKIFLNNWKTLLMLHGLKKLFPLQKKIKMLQSNKRKAII
jgi:hypothetical protein